MERLTDTQQTIIAEEVQLVKSILDGHTACFRRFIDCYASTVQMFVGRFLSQQEDVEDGQIAAVMIDGEATLKRIYHTGDTITLAPANPKYPPKVYSKDNCQQFKILGLVVCVQIRF